MKLDWEKLLSTKSKSTGSLLEDNDKRDFFEKAYDNIIFSSPFRRLQDKTQLFPADSNDFVRTRLTHSLEVAAIARSLGLSTFSTLMTKLSESGAELYGLTKNHIASIPKVLECAGLVHDLGNPPFGHSAEKTIQESFSKLSEKSFFKILNKEQQTDFTKFDGNVQTFRILTHLQCIKDLNGMHIPEAILGTILKYPFNSVDGNKNTDIIHKKFGFFEAEKDVAETILNNLGLKDNDKITRHPLTYLLEAADDIAYLAGDIEDGFKKNILSFEMFEQIFQELKDDDFTKKIKNNLKLDSDNSIKYDCNYITHEKRIQRIRIIIQGEMISSCVDSFCENYDKIMTGAFDKELLTQSKANKLKDALKKLSSKLMLSQQVLLKEKKAKDVISFFVKYFTKAIFDSDEEDFLEVENDNWNFGKKVDKLAISYLSEDFMQILFRRLREDNVKKSDKQTLSYYALLLITDFISGMTDDFCFNLYANLKANYGIKFD